MSRKSKEKYNQKKKEAKIEQKDKYENYNEKLKLDNIIIIELSEQSIRYLNRIARNGIYGMTVEIVAQRFIDEKIQSFIEVEDIKIIL